MSTIRTFIVLVLAMGVAPVHATLIGDSVTCEGNSLLKCAQFGLAPTGLDATAVVDGAALEFSITNLNDIPLFDVDVGADSITITSRFSSGPDLSSFGTVTFSDLDWIGFPGFVVSGFALSTTGITTSSQPGSDGTALDDDDISFADHSVSVHFGHTSWSGPGVAEITLEKAPGASPAPEPATALLLGLGLGLAGFAGRRRTR